MSIGFNGNGQPVIIEAVTPQMNMNVNGTSRTTTTVITNTNVGMMQTNLIVWFQDLRLKTLR